MTNAYRAVQWNRTKKIYDLVLVGWVALYLVTFVALGVLLFPGPESISLPVLLIRALGTCAIIMLHVILMIGPLSRLTSRVSPMLYNRRHLGVAFFLIALLHATLVIGYYGGFGVVNPVLAVLAPPGAPGRVPYEFLGFLALLIFAMMATTSHDFWLANLGAPFWKLMHMSVYIAYALVLAHVIFGSLQTEKNIIIPLLLSLGAMTLITLHLLAGLGEVRRDHRPDILEVIRDGDRAWADVCSVDEIKPGRAKVVQVGDRERIAVFRNLDHTISAVTNVCAHQGGPLGEGKIVNGCLTCPWHGYQYNPANGQSPPPYSEKIATYSIRVLGRRVLIDPVANTPGTPVTPTPFEPLDPELLLDEDPVDA